MVCTLVIVMVDFIFIEVGKFCDKHINFWFSTDLWLCCTLAIVS